jgi:L-malate glycosyltransferase
MRVAFCLDNLNIGGTELNAVRTAELLVNAGVKLRVYCLSGTGPLLARYQAAGVQVEMLPIRSLYGVRAAQQGARLVRLLRSDRVALLHTHDFYSNIFAAPWARLAGVPQIASRRWWEGPERRALREANRLASTLARRVLVNSPAIGRYLTAVERVPGHRQSVIPNFLEPDCFAPPPPDWTDRLAAELGLPDRRFVVGVLASLQPIKDQATLLRAVARLAPAWPELHVVLVGRDGGTGPTLRALAAQLGIADRLRFAGERPSRPSPHHLFDVSALTSVSEGMPNSLLEAMAASKPVVATRVGAVADLVEDGVTGRLVAAGDDAEFAGALAEYLVDRARGRRDGAAGRERARRDYSSAYVLERLLALYGEVARKVPRACPSTANVGV